MSDWDGSFDSQSVKAFSSDNWGGGMSLRDWFAGQAMAAIIAKAPNERVAREMSAMVAEIACGAYDYADAMLAERSRKGGDAT